MKAHLDYYATFYYVAKYGSFSAAAKVLYNNQPNVTRIISKLEQELGCTLFIRSNHGVTLTPEGEVLLKYVEVIHNAVEQAEAELKDATGLKRGFLSFAASETALNIYLLDRLKRFHNRYPGIGFRMTQSNSISSINELERGGVGFAVVSTPVAIPPSVRTRKMMPFRELLIASPDTAASIKDGITFASLLNWNFIGLDKGTATYGFYDRLFRRNDQKYAPDTLVNTTDQLISLVKSDIGIGFVPEPYVRDALQRGEVVAIPTEIEVPTRYIILAVDKRRTLSITAREFVSWLKEEARMSHQKTTSR